jgi:hypothetical protein
MIGKWLGARMSTRSHQIRPSGGTDVADSWYRNEELGGGAVHGGGRPLHRHPQLVGEQPLEKVYAARGADHDDVQATVRFRNGQDKGQRRELELFAEAVRTGAPLPIVFESLVATTSVTIAVADSLASGQLERV